MIKSQKITTITHYNSQLNNYSLLTDIAQKPWITTGNDCPFDQVLKHKLKNFNHASIGTHNDLTRLQLVTENKGLSFLESEEAKEAEQNNQVKVLSQLDFEIPLYCVFKKSRINEPIIKTIIQEIEAL